MASHLPATHIGASAKHTRAQANLPLQAAAAAPTQPLSFPMASPRTQSCSLQLLLLSRGDALMHSRPSSGISPIEYFLKWIPTPQLGRPRHERELQRARVQNLNPTAPAGGRSCICASRCSRQRAHSDGEADDLEEEPARVRELEHRDADGAPEGTPPAVVVGQHGARRCRQQGVAAGGRIVDEDAWAEAPGEQTRDEEDEAEADVGD